MGASGNTQVATPSTSAQETSTYVPPITTNECKICYQFPNGVRVVKVFPCIAKFRDVYDAIKDVRFCLTYLLYISYFFIGS